MLTSPPFCTYRPDCWYWRRIRSGAVAPASRVPNHWSKLVLGVICTSTVTPLCAVWYASANALNVLRSPGLFQELSVRLALPISGDALALPLPVPVPPQAAARASAPVPMALLSRNSRRPMARAKNSSPTVCHSPSFDARGGATAAPTAAPASPSHPLPLQSAHVIGHTRQPG